MKIKNEILWKVLLKDFIKYLIGFILFILSLVIFPESDIIICLLPVVFYLLYPGIQRFFYIYADFNLKSESDKEKNVKQIEILKDTVTFYFKEKIPPITMPYELFEDISMNMKGFYYKDRLMIPDYKFVFIKLDFKLLDDRVFHISNYSFSTNFPLALLRKLSDYTKDKCKLIQTFNGSDEYFIQNIQEEADYYSKFHHTRISTEKDRYKIITISLLSLFVGCGFIIMALGHSLSHKITTVEWIYLSFGSLMVVSSFYFDFRLLQDEIFNFKAGFEKSHSIVNRIALITKLALVFILYLIIKKALYL